MASGKPSSPALTQTPPDPASCPRNLIWRPCQLPTMAGSKLALSMVSSAPLESASQPLSLLQPLSLWPEQPEEACLRCGCFLGLCGEQTPCPVSRQYQVPWHLLPLCLPKTPCPPIKTRPTMQPRVIFHLKVPKSTVPADPQRGMWLRVTPSPSPASGHPLGLGHVAMGASITQPCTWPSPGT